MPPAPPHTREEDGPFHFWVDGAVLHRDDPALDRALLDVGHCYTTARVSDGRARWAERHAARLARDARNHALEAPEAETVHRALESLARAEFGSGSGVVRLQLGLDRGGRPHLVGVPRGLGVEAMAWRLGRAPVTHQGPGRRAGAKLLEVPFITSARRWLAASAFDEAALFDARGHLVEGTRANLIVVCADGAACFPDPALGAVFGIALEVAREQVAPLTPSRITEARLNEATEIIALNAVRGARPVLEWDGRPVGEGVPGPFARRLEQALEEAPREA
jgi:branched-chain amino acid aminotransferase